MGAQKKGARAHLLASFLLAALATQAFLVSARTAPSTDNASQGAFSSYIDRPASRLSLSCILMQLAEIVLSG